MTWKLALRHLTRHWRLYLVMFTIMILGAALLASLPMLAISIAGESLAKSLESAPIFERNLLIHGKSRTDEPPEEIPLTLVGLQQEIIAYREARVPGISVIEKAAGEDLNLYPATIVLHLRSFDHLHERVRVLEGRFPEGEAIYEDEEPTPIFETVIGPEVARRVGLVPGDKLSPTGDRYKLKIVGIVEPIDTNAAAWWGDRQMMPFSVWRRIYTSPNIDEWNISLLIPPQSMIMRIPHDQYWRIVLDHEKINISNAADVRSMLTGLQSILSEEEMVLSTELIGWITKLEEALALAQVSLLLLTCQSLFAVFYLLGMIGNFLVERAQTELATLSGRGFNRAQITGLFACSTTLLALLAGTMAPLVAYGFLELWTNWQSYPTPEFIPTESWWLALGTGVFSWIFLLISIYRAARPDLLPGQGEGRRFDDASLTYRHIIWDVFILTIGGLGYWQLTQGSTITNEISKLGEETGTGISDLVLLLAPSLLLLAISLILIRLLPYMWKSFSRISHQANGLIWNLVFTRLARQPMGPSQITLLISLTAGLTFFASAFTTTIENWQQSMARYEVGADIRLGQSLLEPISTKNIPELPAGAQTTEVLQTKATILLNEHQRLDFNLLAVDTETFSNVISYPQGVSSFSIEQIMGVLHKRSHDVLPVIIASSIQTNHLNYGDQITIELGEESYPAVVVGIINHFPHVDDLFVITDLAQFSQQADLETIHLTDQGTREIWLAVDPIVQKAFITQLEEAGLEDLIAGNSLEQLKIFRNNFVFRVVATAFELNAIVLIPLSVVGFSLIQLFTLQRRDYEFSVLQALGLSKSQLRSLLIREGVIFISLGLLLGIGIGYGLAIIMQPFLAQILPALSGNLVLNHILVNWSEVGMRSLILIVCYGIGLFILLFSAIRQQRKAPF